MNLNCVRVHNRFTFINQCFIFMSLIGVWKATEVYYVLPSPQCFYTRELSLLAWRNPFPSLWLASFRPSCPPITWLLSFFSCVSWRRAESSNKRCLACKSNNDAVWCYKLVNIFGKMLVYWVLRRSFCQQTLRQALRTRRRYSKVITIHMCIYTLIIQTFMSNVFPL